MATVHLVSPDLVKRTNTLLVKVQRRRLLQSGMHDWVALLEANPAQQSDPQSNAGLLERGCEPSKEKTTEQDAQALDRVAHALVQEAQAQEQEQLAHALVPGITGPRNVL